MTPTHLILIIAAPAIVAGLVLAVRAVRRKRITPPPGPQVSPRANPPPSDPP
jgi:hypothetical protein